MRRIVHVYYTRNETFSLKSCIKSKRGNLWWLECDIGDQTLKRPISDFVDQGVQAILNTTSLFSKRLLLNATSDRNNPLLL